MNTLDGFKLLLATVTVGLTSGPAGDPHQFFGGAAPLLRTLNIGVAHASTMQAAGTTTTPPFASQLSLGSSALGPIRAVTSSVLGHFTTGCTRSVSFLVSFLILIVVFDCAFFGKAAKK